MDFESWAALSAEEQYSRCQQLNPYEDWPLFKAVEAEFLREYGDQPGVASAFCGFADVMGPLNAITVTIKRGQRRTRLPETYLGFFVLRRYSPAPKTA